MKWLGDLLELFFPHSCCLCGTALVAGEEEICTHCLLSLPMTDSAGTANNIVEQLFAGRIPIEAASSLLHFSKRSTAQTILHQIKYHGNTNLALHMGSLIGNALAQSHRFDDVELLIPVPLHPRKERRRGYNQSLLLCQGIALTFPHPIEASALVRTRRTETQTNKNREQRLDNMKDVFTLKDSSKVAGKHVLLVDDVITTGATSEACCLALLNAPGIKVSIASLAIAG